MLCVESLTHLSVCDGAAQRPFTLSMVVSATYWTEVILNNYLALLHNMQCVLQSRRSFLSVLRYYSNIAH